MYCINCGKPISDDTAFCIHCGFPLKVQSPPPPTERNPDDNPVFTEFVKLARSPALLVAVISFTVYMVLMVLSSLTTVDTIRADILSDIVDSFRSGNIVPILISVAVDVTMLVGMWKILLSARNPVDGFIKTTGLTLIKVSAIIKTVFVSIALLLTLFVLFLACFGLSVDFILSDIPEYTDFSEDAPVFAIAFLSFIFFALILVGMLSLFIVFYLKLVKTVKTVTFTITTGYASAKVSSFVYVMCFIIGGFSIFIGFDFITDPLSLISTVAVTVSSISFGVFLRSYKIVMKNLVHSGYGEPIPHPPMYYPPQNGYMGPPPFGGNGFYQ